MPTTHGDLSTFISRQESEPPIVDLHRVSEMAVRLRILARRREKRTHLEPCPPMTIILDKISRRLKMLQSAGWGGFLEVFAESELRVSRGLAVTQVRIDSAQLPVELRSSRQMFGDASVGVCCGDSPQPARLPGTVKTEWCEKGRDHH
jgi:hypothetical protein